MTSPDKIKDWKKELRYLPQLYKGSKADILAIESFISSLLQARDREIIEKIKGIKHKYKGDGLIAHREDMYEMCIDDIITNLTREDNE